MESVAVVLVQFEASCYNVPDVVRTDVVGLRESRGNDAENVLY